MFACLRKLVDRRIRRAIASVSRRCRLSGITKAKSFFVSSSFPRAQCAESTTYYVAGNTLRANRTAVARCFTCKRLVPVCRRSRTQPCSGHVRSKKLEHLRSGVGRRATMAAAGQVSPKLSRSAQSGRTSSLRSRRLDCHVSFGSKAVCVWAFARSMHFSPQTIHVRASPTKIILSRSGVLRLHRPTRDVFGDGSLCMAEMRRKVMTWDSMMSSLWSMTLGHLRSHSQAEYAALAKD